MYCDYSSISCGVNQVYGFEDYRVGDDGYDVDDTGYATPETMLKDVSNAIYHSQAEQLRYSERERLRLPAVHFMFSDIEGKEGDVFGQWLAEQDFGTVMRVTGRNPNSGNTIATYLWVPNESALMKHPSWRSGRAVANKWLRQIRKGRW